MVEYHVRCNNPYCINTMEVTLKTLRSNKKLFCSNKCRYKTHYLKLNKITKTCKTCGEKFDTFDMDKNHCTLECENGDPPTIASVTNEPITYECYQKFKSVIDRYYDDKIHYYNCKNIIPLSSIETYYQEHKGEKFNIINARKMIQEFIEIHYENKKSEALSIRAVTNKKNEPRPDDPAYLFVKCNNPNCDDWFPINLYNLNKATHLFCSDSCKVEFHKLQRHRTLVSKEGKLPKLVKRCKRCHRKFRTYDASREFCCHYCELYKNNRLSSNQYRYHITSGVKSIYDGFVSRYDAKITLEEFINIEYKKYEIDKLYRIREMRNHDN